MSKLITSSSLFLGVLIVLIFNFLTAGNSKIFTENITEINFMTENFGINANTIQIYQILIGLGLILYLNGILGIYKGIGNREYNIKPIALSLNIIAVTLFICTLAIGNTFASSAELNMGAYQVAQQAAQAAASGDPAAIEFYNNSSINSIIAGAAAAGVYAIYWGAFAISTYVIYLATITTGYIILKSGNHYLSSLMNYIVGFGLMGSGMIFLVLNLVWKVNTELGYQMFMGSQIIWALLIIILSVNILRSKKA
tara:strand:+ start:396 stop:1157 length:762 start_codon:yes stop_codon:yes gene_type:complete